MIPDPPLDWQATAADQEWFRNGWLSQSGLKPIQLKPYFAGSHNWLSSTSLWPPEIGILIPVSGVCSLAIWRLAQAWHLLFAQLLAGPAFIGRVSNVCWAIQTSNS